MTDIAILPGQSPRLETGVTQFGDDWPGVFIRGDQSAYYGFLLQQILENKQLIEIDPILEMQVKSLANLLQSCIVGGNKDEDR